jgi:cation transporter-like permease
MKAKRIARHHIEKLRKLRRRQHHPLLHEIHRKHNISKRTLFYVKEYGPHSSVPRTIIRESIKILLLASIISSIGGFAVENIKLTVVSLMPIIILLPVLNGTIGNYGAITSSKFSTMLHEGISLGGSHTRRRTRKLFLQMFAISIITALLSSALAVCISAASGFGFSTGIAAKVFAISVINMAILVFVMFSLSMYAGKYFFRKGEDPNNFLIPVTTSVADLCNMVILAALVLLMF